MSEFRARISRADSSFHISKRRDLRRERIDGGHEGGTDFEEEFRSSILRGRSPCGMTSSFVSSFSLCFEIGFRFGGFLWL